jgi:hypothetical protein
MIDNRSAPIQSRAATTRCAPWAGTSADAVPTCLTRHVPAAEDFDQPPDERCPAPADPTALPRLISGLIRNQNG